MKNKILAALIAILAFGQGAMAASSFTVTNPTGSTFRITRTGNTAVSETIDWRVVSLSAIAGVHFTGVGGQYSGTVTFNADEPYRDVTISESNPGDNAYKYQNGTDRSYRFEVLDRNGDILAACDRSITSGLSQFSTTKVSSSITNLVTMSSGNFSSGMSSSKYLDVSYTPSTSQVETSGTLQGYVLIDDSYDYAQKPATVSTSTLISSTGASASYLNTQNYKIYATVCFTEKERDDGYQYLQIIAGDSSVSYDTGADPNGAVNDPSNSIYKVCFEFADGSNAEGKAYFPHRGSTSSEFSNANGKLHQQKYKSGYDGNGAVILPVNTSYITTRFDAGGDNDDTWGYKDFFVRMALCDNSAPTVLNNYKVSGGRHQKGNTIYVSVAFSEIVVVTGTPTLSSNWGMLSYTSGSGSNVLTFKGTIDPADNNPFNVSSYDGTIKDLANNNLSGSISHNFGTTLDSDYAWSASDFHQLETNTYEIATKLDLRHLALMVNSDFNDCSGLTFRQTSDIICDNTYIPIGCYTSSYKYFSGTYDGQGFTVSGITVTRTGNTKSDGYIGLFGCIGSTRATVKNVVLANSTFTGYSDVGGIVGYNYEGTVQNCRVESTVTINAGNNGACNYGGIVGYNNGSKVIGCVSAATVSPNGKSGSRYYGGILGVHDGVTVKNCLYTGTGVDADNYKGAVVGNKYSGTLTNNYYTTISLGGVGADGSSADQNGARRARTVTLGEGVALVGGVTYDVSGLTAIGTSALRTSDGTIYSGEGQTLTLSYTGAIPDGYTLSGYSVNGMPIDGNSFTMPAGDVTVTANVVPVITYIDADGNEQSVVGPTPIVSNEFPQYYGAEGQTNWYYVSGPVSSRQIKFSDATSNIILCDGATLSINAGSLSGIINENGSVNIFSQSRGSGSITVSGTSYSSKNGINAKSNIDINGGTFTSSVTDYGLYSKEGDVTIRGGIVNISARYDGIFGKENVNIIGGIVNASSTSSNSSYGGISSSGNITIGVSSASDRITASSYKYTTLKVADGQTLTDGTDTYTGTLNADQIATIAGKTLRMPFDPAEGTVNLTAHSGTLAGQTHYWATFYHPNWNYTLPAGAKAYIVKEDKNLYRVGDGTIIPAGVAVVIMAESASLTLTATNANAPAVVGNILQGSNSAVPVAGLSGTPYVLGKVGDVLGFYQYTGTDLPAGKAYYVVVTP